MAESRSHQITATRIAKKLETEYNSGKGVDIKSKKAIVTVETPETVGEGSINLRGQKGPVYIAGTNKEAVEKAIEAIKGTTIGVMDNQGKIVKKSTRKK